MSDYEEGDYCECGQHFDEHDNELCNMRRDEAAERDNTLICTNCGGRFDDMLDNSAGFCPACYTAILVR